jgi:two-component system sensor histidine kinase PilS (NtrC family)
MPMALPAKNLMTGYLPIVRWMLILRPAIVTSTLGVAMLVLPRESIDKFPIAVVVFGTYLLTLLYWLTLRFSGISRSLLATQIAFDIFIITIIIHYTGGYDSSFVGFYFLSIMCASLFFRRLVTFIFSLASMIAYDSYIFVFEFPFGSTLLDPAVRQGLVLQAFLYSILMLAVGFFSSYYSERLIRKDTALSSALRLLKEARLDTSDILQSMNNGLIAFDRSGRVMYFNQAALNIFQIDQMTGLERYDSMLAHRAGKLVDIVRRELSDNSSGAEEEIEIIGRDGFPIPIGLTTVPLFDNDGGRRGMIMNFKDLTDKQKLLEMLRQSDRMAAIGELSAAIAHEIRNPLAAICNAVELLGEEIEDREGRVSRLLQVIEKESDRLQRTTSEFLKFARMRNPDIIRIELKNAIDEVILLIENDPRKTEQVVIRNRVNGNQAVYFDPDHLKQLLINVMINSLDALGGNGEIEIGLEKKKKAADTFVRLIISDNGPGFPEDVIGSVFEPFFSTKKEGTGLGLALVRKIAVSNQGRVFAKNRKNGGAEIALDIPVNGAENV